MKCPNCRLENPPGALHCDCGYEFTGGASTTPYSITYGRRRYPALRIISFIYRVFAVLVVVGTFSVIVIGGSRDFRFVVWALLGGFVGVITCLATAEMIVVFVDIEHNTRNTYDAITKTIHKPKN